jgi:hypothetical protein
MKDVFGIYGKSNGRGRYTIIDMAEYEKLEAMIKLLSQLSDAEKAIENEADWLSSEDVIMPM